jgi:adenylate cyclase
MMHIDSTNIGPDINQSIIRPRLLSRLCTIFGKSTRRRFDTSHVTTLLFKIPARLLPNIGRILLYFSIGIAIGFGYAKVTHTAFMFGFINGIAITFFIGLFEIFLEQTRAGYRIRRAHFVCYFLIVSTVWTGLILLSLEGVTHFFARLGIDSGDPLRHQVHWTLLTDIVVSIGFVFIIDFLGRIKSLVGSRTLARLVLGHYRRPLWENRVFLFIDIVDSTRLTQELGTAKAQSMFTEFFSDIDEPIHQFGGETHRYIGDEVVVTWAFNEADNAIETIRSIGNIVRHRAGYYIEHYGTVPRFRAGVHCGEIVSGKVGSQRKREIVFFGDTINTVARLTALTREVGVDALVSESLVENLANPCSALKPLGAFQLKGRAEPLSVYHFDF